MQSFKDKSSADNETDEEHDERRHGTEKRSSSQPRRPIRPMRPKSWPRPDERLLRLQAEMQNLRNRTSREIADERKYAALPVLRDLLPVIDNIDRAIEAAEKAGEAENLLAGFRLVKQQLHTILSRNECVPIPAENEAVRPEFPSSDFAAAVGRRAGRQCHDGDAAGLQAARPRGAPGASDCFERPAASSDACDRRS